MKFASTASVEPLGRAVRESAAVIRAALGNESPPHLVLVFVSEHHSGEYERVPELLAREFPSALILGCSAGGVIGGAREIERQPGFSLTAAFLPDVEVRPLCVAADAIPAPTAAPADWERCAGVGIDAQPDFILLPDPFTFDCETFLRGLDATYAHAAKIGGLASGGRRAEQNALFLGGERLRSGLVGVSLSGDVRIDPIVAQGCRPIGLPMFVTRCEQNVIWELDGQRPLAVLQELYAHLDPRDRQLVHHSLFLGIAMNESQCEYHAGDFLIRNIIGADNERGALAVGASLKEGAVVQFHLRDAEASAADLTDLLARYRRNRSTPPQGALLFSCLGRGVYLYGRPDHDSSLFRRVFGEVPLGGFFCNGEIGPVHGKTFLHGYTSAFGLFRRR